MIATQTITIRVSPEAARAYNTATAEQQRKLEALLSLKLTEVTRSSRPLEEIMSEISQKAQSRGLTPEMLPAKNCHDNAVHAQKDQRDELNEILCRKSS